MRGVHHRLLCVTATMAGLVFVASVGVSPAFAGALWRLDLNSAPTYLSPGVPARIVATASNIGDSPLDGAGAHPVTISDRLPGGLRLPAALAATGIEGKFEANDRSEAASELECSIAEPDRREVSCKTGAATEPLAPYTQLRVVMPVEVTPGAASGEEDTVSVSGGEAIGVEEFSPALPLSRPIAVKDEATPFGIEHYELTPEEEDGTVDARAGSHPFQLTTTLDLNEILANGGEGQAQLQASAPALARKLSFELPPGLLGDPQAIPQCPDEDFSTIGANDVNACPADTAIGVALVTLNLPSPPLGVFSEAVPVFNLAPAPGEPARFGFEDTKVPIILDTSVRTSGDYGVTVTIDDTTQVAQLLQSQVTLWGDPAAEAHDGSRGWACIRASEVNGERCTSPAQRGSTPFLTLPTSCTGSLATRLAGEAWDGEQAQGEYTLQAGPGEELTSLIGCESVPFAPQISLAPVEEQEGKVPGAPTTSASTPTGMNVMVALPSESGGLGESAVKETTVTLPRGVQLSPSAANGLQACSESEIGYEGPPGTSDPLSPGAPEPARFSAAPAGCPPASKVGLVHIKSPDLAHELEGSVYLAEQDNNPFGSLLALYLVAEDPEAGITVKLAGHVTLNEETGQVTTTFKDTPQVPFETLTLHFFEGPRASLSTPATCGAYAATSVFSAWSGDVSEPTASEPFQITSGAQGTGCASPLAFAPAFTAGVTSLRAGGFSPFSLTISKRDGDQSLSGVVMHLPEGVAALLSSVTPCREPAAGQGWSCGPESLIGHSTAWSGLGSEPYELPGSVYLTTGFGGAPFGLVVVTPAVAGPFDLGDVDVRSRIEVDPDTAAVTITSDPFPQFVKGIPVQLKQLNVTVDRPGFEFNPTSCDPLKITGTLTGAEGASEAVSSPFQVADCQGLPFAPKLTASVAGHATKANGTTFTVKLDSKGLGQANIKKVALQLPVQLPSRLTTIQKACADTVFATNPAACPEWSNIGSATVHTPVLKNPLSGPAYLVSHGNAAFPDVEFVLQGEGITVILDGQTDIKKGITTSTFNAIPDAPVTSFETTLPEGPHSALTSNVPESKDFSLCGSKLTMPTTITAQNGAVITQQTKIPVLGCGAVKGAKYSRSQLLAKALKKCRTQFKHSKRKRATCEAKARKRYPVKKKAAKKKAATRARATDRPRIG
jgi:hypothetical protein